MIARALLLGLLILPCATLPAEPIEVRAAPVPLDAADPARVHVGRLTYLGGLHLTSPSALFGGLSALQVSDDGGSMVSVTDEGCWFRAQLQRDATGAVTAVTQAEVGPLRGRQGEPLDGKVNQDAESLARLADGSWVVGYERRHRLWRYATGPWPLDGAAEPFSMPDALLKAPTNGGVEALAVLADGRLVALSEELLTSSGVRGFVRDGRRWRGFTYPVRGLLRPSDATGLPSGALLVLERGYSPDAGVTVRLRRVRARDLRRNAVLAGEVVAELQPPLTVDNFEGVAARRGPSGETFVDLLSDDNFSAQQRTLLMSFVLDESGLVP